MSCGMLPRYRRRRGRTAPHAEGVSEYAARRPFPFVHAVSVHSPRDQQSRWYQSCCEHRVFHFQCPGARSVSTSSDPQPASSQENLGKLSEIGTIVRTAWPRGPATTLPAAASRFPAVPRLGVSILRGREGPQCYSGSAAQRSRTRAPPPKRKNPRR